MENYTDKEINTILNAYQQKRAREQKNYDLKKDSAEWKAYNQKKSNKWYEKNKGKRAEHYLQNKSFYRCKSSYIYYKKQGREGEFIEKYPEKYQTLIDNHYLSDILPSESV